MLRAGAILISWPIVLSLVLVSDGNIDGGAKSIVVRHVASIGIVYAVASAVFLFRRRVRLRK